MKIDVTQIITQPNGENFIMLDRDRKEQPLTLRDVIGMAAAVTQNPNEILDWKECVSRRLLADRAYKVKDFMEISKSEIDTLKPLFPKVIHPYAAADVIIKLEALVNSNKLE